MKPKLTLILPVYNVESTVIRCLESIYRQPEVNEVEVILVDDGSPDESYNVANEWLISRHATNARIIRQENKGLGGARNTGIDNARAPYVWFVDTDDELPDGALNVVLSHLGECAEMFGFNIKRVPEPKTQYTEITNYVSDIDGTGLAAMGLEPLTPKNIYNVEFLNKNNLRFREHFLHEDNDFTLRVNLKLQHATLYPDYIYLYHTGTPGSIMNSPKLKNIVDILHNIDTFIEFAPSDNYSRRVFQRSLSTMMSAVLRRSVRLCDQDWKEYKPLIRSYKSRLMRVFAGYGTVYGIYMMLISSIPNRTFYKLLFKILALR